MFGILPIGVEVLLVSHVNVKDDDHLLRENVKVASPLSRAVMRAVIVGMNLAWFSDRDDEACVTCVEDE